MSPREARRPLVRPAVVAGIAVLALLDNLAGLVAGVTVALSRICTMRPSRSPATGIPAAAP